MTKYLGTNNPVRITHKINHHVFLPNSQSCLIHPDFSTLTLKAELSMMSFDLHLSPCWASHNFLYFIWALITIYFSVFICEIIWLTWIPTKLCDPEGQGFLTCLPFIHGVLCILPDTTVILLGLENEWINPRMNSLS